MHPCLSLVKLLVPMRFVAALLIVIASSFSQVFAQNKITFHDIKPGMKDEWLERQALRIANERATNLHWLAEYKRAKIISQKWTVVRDYDGYPLGRTIDIELYCIKPNGDCAMADFVFKQKYKDEEYSDRLICLHVGEFINIDCE